jgi:hypothetical protein
MTLFGVPVADNQSTKPYNILWLVMYQHVIKHNHSSYTCSTRIVAIWSCWSRPGAAAQHTQDTYFCTVTESTSQIGRHSIEGRTQRQHLTPIDKSFFLKYFKWFSVIWPMTRGLFERALSIMIGWSFGINLINAWLKNWRAFHSVSLLLTNVYQHNWTDNYNAHYVEVLYYSEWFYDGRSSNLVELRQIQSHKRLSKVSSGYLFLSGQYEVKCDESRINQELTDGSAG